MDAAHLTQLFALTGIALGIGRFVLSSLGRAGDAVSGAFATIEPGVPQRARQPTGSWWQAARTPDADLAIAAFIELDPVITRGAQTVARRGTFVVPPIRVAPIQLRVLAA